MAVAPLCGRRVLIPPPALVPDLEHLAGLDLVVGDAAVDRLGLQLSLAFAGDDRVETTDPCGRESATSPGP